MPKNALYGDSVPRQTAIGLRQLGALLPESFARRMNDIVVIMLF